MYVLFEIQRNWFWGWIAERISSAELIESRIIELARVTAKIFFLTEEVAMSKEYFLM